MAPAAAAAAAALALFRRRSEPEPKLVTKPTNPDGLVLEAWAQGYMVGSLIIMACITVANMRRGVLLHKLILMELIFGTLHGTWIFAHEPAYGWYLSSTAIFLNVSWSLHNVIAWMKSRPFLSRKVSIFYIATVIIVQPYWILEIYANFAYFNNVNDIFLKTRPLEALFRDPWWIFTTLNLVYNIRVRYDISFSTLVRTSPRFAILLIAMVLSIGFMVVDIMAVTDVFSAHALPDGINPFWKLSFVFKCLTDTIVLDDFKTALDRLRQINMGALSSAHAQADDRAGFDRLDRDYSLESKHKSLKLQPISTTEHVDDISRNPNDISLRDALRMPRRNSATTSENQLV